MHVLIADDEPVSRRLLQSYLQKWEYEVTTAQNGAEAWRLFQETNFAIVITDWMMPEVDGLELIRRIRATQRPGYVHATLLTAKAQKEDLVEGMEAGADDFLTKPFDRDELRVRLRAAERISSMRVGYSSRNSPINSTSSSLSPLTRFSKLVASYTGAAVGGS